MFVHEVNVIAMYRALHYREVAHVIIITKERVCDIKVAHSSRGIYGLIPIQWNLPKWSFWLSETLIRGKN